VLEFNKNINIHTVEMKHQKVTVGSVVRISLPDNQYAFGRLLEKNSVAIYDYISKNIEVDLQELINRNIIFIVAIYKDVVTSGRWKIIGEWPLEEKLKILPNKFIQDDINPSNFRIYDPNTGIMKKSTFEDCVYLEPAAVWEGEHVEDRIVDYKNGKPNKWLENIKITKPN